jgi:hypothetical protein
MYSAKPKSDSPNPTSYSLNTNFFTVAKAQQKPDRLMADIFLHFKNKFARNPELIANEPLVHQSLERTNEEVTDYDQWKISNAQLAVSHWLNDQFLTLQCAPERTHDAIDFTSSVTTKGFVLHPALTRFSDNNVRHLFTYLKDQLIRLGYYVSLSDTRVYGRGYWDETHHRHILKPHAEFGMEFAQVTLELMLKDNKMVSLSLKACVPNTDLPRPSEDLADLMQNLLV